MIDPFPVISKLWDIYLIMVQKYCNENLNLLYFGKRCLKFFEFFLLIMNGSWSMFDKFFVVGFKRYNELCCSMQWNFVAYYCCMGVYTSNNHSQQGHAKFVLQSEGV